jgi:hypothetical protein
VVIICVQADTFCPFKVREITLKPLLLAILSKCAIPAANCGVFSTTNTQLGIAIYELVNKAKAYYPVTQVKKY